MAEGRNVLLKRLRQDSDDQEIMCQRCDYLTKDRVVCSGCKLNFCLKCANISTNAWQCITKGEMDHFIWSCRCCRATFPSLDNISRVLGDIQKTTNTRMDKFEERLNNVEQRNKNDIETCVANMKTEIIDSLKDNMESLVDKRTKEIEERKRRDNNLVIFNVPEHSHAEAEFNKRADSEDVRELSSALGLDNLQIKALFRLGQKKVSAIRPLKLVLEMKSQRKYLMDNTKQIEEKAPEHLKRVIIVRDLTPTQRAERKKKRNQARNDNAQEEQDRAPVPMEMGNNPLPSPILRQGETNLSQYNRHADSEVFDETTVINTEANAFKNTTDIGEETVIGGYNHQSRGASPASSTLA